MKNKYLVKIENVMVDGEFCAIALTAYLSNDPSAEVRFEASMKVVDGDFDEDVLHAAIADLQNGVFPNVESK